MTYFWTSRLPVFLLIGMSANSFPQKIRRSDCVGLMYFSLKSVIMVNVRFELHDQQLKSFRRRHILRHYIVRWASYW